MVELRSVNDLNKYFERLNIAITMSPMWNALQSKTEYGSDKSEKGYQLVAKSMAANIARGLNLNVDLAEVLTMCKGVFFPVKGEQGKKCILQYMKQNNIQMTESDLAVAFVEYDLSQNGNIVTPELDALLKSVFNEQGETKVPEVQVARICNEVIEGVKRIERYSTIPQVDLLYGISKDVEHASIEQGKPTIGERTQRMFNATPRGDDTELPTEIREKIYSDLDTFIAFSNGNAINGICEYIGSDDEENLR